MLIPFTERTAPRYIYINPKSGLIHVLMPVMTGTEIGLDNTCKSVFSLQEFFGKSQDIHQKAIFDELCTYKSTLEYDISLIDEDSEIKEKKQKRLFQINLYIEAIKAVLESDVLDGLRKAFPEYPKALQEVMSKEDSNLHSMVLRPKVMDEHLRLANPIFSVNRKDESVLYNVLSDAYGTFKPQPNAKSRFMASVLRDLKKQNDFEEIQRVLTEQTINKLGIKDIDFYSINKEKKVTKDFIDDKMFYGESVTAQDYIDTLLALCLPNFFDSLMPNAKSRFMDSVLQDLKEQNDFEEIQRVLTEQTIKQLGIKNIDFYSINEEQKITKDYIDDKMFFDESVTAQDYIDTLLTVCLPKFFDTLIESPFYTTKTPEALSILTQFFLGSMNIYCHCNNITSANFGKELDKSPELSDMVATTIILSMFEGTSVEDALLNFVSDNSESFGFKKKLTLTDKVMIKKKFTGQFSAVKDSPHFDEFMLLDNTKSGPFIIHQGGICLNIAELTTKICPKVHPEYFEEVRFDFKELKGVVTHSNPSVYADIDIDIKELVAKIENEEQLNNLLKKLSQDQQREIMDFPAMKRLQLPKFLHHVARGQQDEAEQLLKANPDAQFLLQAGAFTDYSGRTYNCTAYEKTYWDKDTRMCRMLEKYMDEDTKAELLKRCEAIKKDGLKYTQNGKEYCSSHFDLTPLKAALKAYVDGHDDWCDKQNWDAIKKACMDIGQEQRDAPPHVIHEYCSDLLFSTQRTFNEAKLTRTVTFYNNKTERDESVFPLVITESSGLGIDFTLIRGGRPRARA
jgi:hypothetical protein